MSPLLLLVVAVGLAWSFLRPTMGLRLTIVAGFAQELIRKAVPGQSAYWQGLVVAFALSTFLGEWIRRPNSWWRWREWSPVRKPVEAFLVILVIQALVSYARTGSSVLPVVGLIAYMGPLASVAIGSWLGRRERGVEQALTMYVLLATLMAAGIVLAQAGVTWELLKPIGAGLVVYTYQRIELPSGFFRSPEVASWHCATAACITVLLAMVRRRAGVLRNVILAMVFTFLVYGVLAAGRRKGILEIVVFLVALAVLHAISGRSLGRFAMSGLLVASLAGFLLTREEVMLRTKGTVEAMLARERDPGGSGIEDRLAQVFTALPVATSQFGPLGLGLGTMTQGGRYFGADERWGVTSEIGPYRLIVELGIAGVGVVLLILKRLSGSVYRSLRQAREWPLPIATTAMGLFSVIVANAAVFLTAHQIFGDPFVFLSLGFFAGFALTLVADARRAYSNATETRVWNAATDRVVGAIERPLSQ